MRGAWPPSARSCGTHRRLLSIPACINAAHGFLPSPLTFPSGLPSILVLRPAAIEDRNNQLELHSRNNQKLLGALEGLVGRLALDEGAERALQARAITSSR